jgi:hypothetical protein
MRRVRPFWSCRWMSLIGRGNEQKGSRAISDEIMLGTFTTRPGLNLRSPGYASCPVELGAAPTADLAPAP